jgi:hypothetical protein
MQNRRCEDEAMAFTRDDLEAVRREISVALLRIADLERHVEEAEREGRNPVLGKQALTAMREALDLLIAHRDMIERSLFDPNV